MLVRYLHLLLLQIRSAHQIIEDRHTVCTKEAMNEEKALVGGW